MTHHTLSIASFVAFASLAAPSYAAAPEFKVGLITEARTYQREELRKGQTPAAVAQPVRVQIERVTVALEGERITGEWYSGIMFSSDPLTSARLAAAGRHADALAPYACLAALCRGHE